ncbi:MAG: hypothetical protein AABW91_01490 [Nanoarchaeota archaeon]
MGGVRDFLILSFLIIILINIILVSAYLISTQYGSVTLSPGENYTVNIPFFGPSKSPVICGKAQKTSGEVLPGVNVSVYYSNSLVNKSATNSNGQYCVYLPEITSNREYDIFIEYNNQTNTGDFIQLASNDYTLDFDNNLLFSKLSDKYAILKGSIINEEAEIENGRFEINLQYWPINSSERFEIFNYQKYFVNINPQETYDIPNDELNVSWQIPNDAKTGRYKFYIKTSFNAEEKPKTIYFNVSD